jgi:hypothetical protein
MKRTFSALFFLLAGTSAHAAVLGQDVDVRLRPDSSAPVIARFLAGTEPTPAPSAIATTPAGWMAVEVPGPFDVFVANGDVTKTLAISDGATLLLAPSAGATVLATMIAGDPVEITGLRGRWTEVRVQRSVVGYLPVSAVPASSQASLPIAQPALQPAPAPMSPAPLPPPQPSIASTIGSPVFSAPVASAATDPLPRIFQGRFASSQRPFTPRRPYEYQLNDDAGVRIAYVDLSGLMLTEQPDNYIGRVVVVSGLAENSADARSVVIHAETLVLR